MDMIDRTMNMNMDMNMNRIGLDSASNTWCWFVVELPFPKKILCFVVTVKWTQNHIHFGQT